MGGALIKQPGELVHGGSRGLGLFCGEFADRSEQCRINGACVEQQGAENLENASFIVSIAVVESGSRAHRVLAP